MENNEKVIGMNPEEKGDTKLSPINFGTACGVAVIGAAKQLAGKEIYAIGLGAGLLFGKRAGIKTIGTIAGIGAVYNAARYLTGEFHKKDK